MNEDLIQEEIDNGVYWDCETEKEDFMKDLECKRDHEDSAYLLSCCCKVEFGDDDIQDQCSLCRARVDFAYCPECKEEFDI